MVKRGYIYFMTNYNNTVLYVGVTNSLKRRITEHSEGKGSVFTQKYKCKKFVYFEYYNSIAEAISREKQIKHYTRLKKQELVESINPNWEDLSNSIILDPFLF